MRSDRRAEYPTIRKVEVEFLDVNKIYGIKRDKVEKFSGSASKTSGVPLKNPEPFRGGKGSRCRRTAINIGGRRRDRERSYKMGRRIECLQAKLGGSAASAKWGPDRKRVEAVGDRQPISKRLSVARRKKIT